MAVNLSHRSTARILLRFCKCWIPDQAFR